MSKMQKAVLAVTSLPPSTLALAFIRLRKTPLVDEKDPTVRNLLEIKQQVRAALPFIAQSYVNGQTASSSSLFIWLSRERSNECLETLQDGLKQVLPNASSEEAAPSQDEEGNLWGSSRLRYNMLRLLAGSARKLSGKEFLEHVLAAVAPSSCGLLSSTQPTNLTLLARDLVHYLVWKIYEGEGDPGVIFRQRVPILLTLKTELQWAKPSPASSSDCLALGLNELVTVLDYVCVQASREQDEDAATEGNNERDDAHQMLGIYWKSCCRLLAQRSCSVDDIESVVNTLKDPDADVLAARLALRDACLLIGRIDISQLDQSFIPSLMEGAMRALREVKLANEAHTMAAPIVRTVFAASLKHSSAGDLASKLIPLLDDKDGISRAAVELVAEAVFRNPSTCLVEIEHRLVATTSATKRETALAVLTRLIDLRCRAHPSSSSSLFNEMDNRLVALLLAKLGDEKIDIRNQAARAFTTLPPAQVIPKLCTLLVHKDEKKRAAASDALCQCLSHHSDISCAVRVLLAEVQSIQEQEAAFALTPRWVPKIDGEERFHCVISTVVDECIARAGDSPQLMGFARRLGPFISSSEARTKTWVTKVLGKAIKKKVALIERLTPFLLLRILPEINLAEDSRQGLVDVLCGACFAAPVGEEYPEVRRTAVEVLARLPGSVPWSILLEILSSPDKSNELKRAAVYGLCHVLITSLQRNDFGPDAFPSSLASRLVMKAACTLEFGNEKDHDMFVMGITEFFTLALICESFPQWEETGRKLQAKKKVIVQEVEKDEEDEQQSTPSYDIIYQGMCSDESNAKGHQQQQQQRAIASNVLCHVARSILPTMGTSMASSIIRTVVTGDKLANAAIGYARILVTSLVRTWSAQRPPREEDMFVIFTCAFLASSTSSANNQKISVFLDIGDLTVLINACLGSIQERTDYFLTSLKLIGVLLTLPIEVLSDLPEGTIGRIQSVLKGVANMDPMKEARQLAGEIAELSFH